ncbi:MAG: hypothetical protein HGJ94_20190 [Desulfosarcina sp.]|nr:hypothetical protein [Desulfosarcina sp.]
MKVIVYLLGFSCIAMCSFLILYTRESVNALKKLFDSYELRYLSIIPAVTGLLFLVSASATGYPWVFRIIAVIAFAEAVLAIVNPNKIYSRMLDWYFGNLSDQTQRLFGIIGIIFGTVILTWLQ